MTIKPSFSLSRRGFLAGACCAAAAPVLTSFSVAAAPGESRFVTIILRGGMDGLDLVQPYGDAAFAALRPTLGLTPGTGLVDLDGFFGLNPAASALMPLWQENALSFVHAVATPYRDGRRHFDGQTMLENGGTDASQKSGWLNRTLAVIPRTDGRKALDIHTSMELILSGPNKADNRPGTGDVEMAQDEIGFLERLYAADAPFAAAMEEVKRTGFSAGGYRQKRNRSVVDMARLAGGMLREDYRIASFSINGWDTHVEQASQFGSVAGELAAAIVALKDALGADAWAHTVVLAVTEFGRSVRENGTGGTDHGTGSVAVLAGGAVSGGKVMGTWPGLAEDRLLDGQDLMPTGDVREIAAAMLHKQFGIAPDKLTSRVFPGLSFDRSSIYLQG